METFPSSKSIPAALQKAVDLHQHGQLDLAETIYLDILKKQPKHFDANHLLGVLALQKGRTEDALRLLKKALTLNAFDAPAHNNCGNAFLTLKQFDNALTHYNRAISLKSDYADAYFNRGNVLLELKRLDDALENYCQTLRIQPDHVEAHYNKGYTLFLLERLDEAVASCHETIRLKDDHANAYHNLGAALHKLQRWDEALENYSFAIQFNPNNAHTHYQRGNLFKECERYEEALSDYSTALSIQPKQANIYNDQGSVLMALEQLNEALVCFDTALTIEPDFACVHYNRANLLAKMERYEEALESYARAIFIQPNYAEAYTNQGNVLNTLDRLNEALQSYDCAIHLDPKCIEAHWNASLIRLSIGDFERGWKHYEWRWKNMSLPFSRHKRHFDQPLWLGDQTLQNKTILLHAEQGLGDTLQFCRYIPYVKQLGCNILLEIQAPLLPFFKNLENVDQVFVQGDSLPDFDFHTPFMSLPLAFNTTLESIPANIPYLKADPHKVVYWEKKLGRLATPHIGLVWAGNLAHVNDMNRSIPLSYFSTLFEANREYISLQKDIREYDKKHLKSLPIHHFDHELKDFSDTAALIMCLDLVITADTAVAHLAGALGKPVWILLPHVSDWRWLRNRDDSPWYPSACLFRQQTQGDWPAVLTRVAEALRIHYPALNTTPPKPYFFNIFNWLRRF